MESPPWLRFKTLIPNYFANPRILPLPRVQDAKIQPFQAVRGDDPSPSSGHLGVWMICLFGGLEKTKNICPKCWCNGDFRMVESVKHHLKQIRGAVVVSVLSSWHGNDSWRSAITVTMDEDEDAENVLLMIIMTMIPARGIILKLQLVSINLR